jgi:hypothetical protein
LATTSHDGSAFGDLNHPSLMSQIAVGMKFGSIELQEIRRTHAAVERVSAAVM